MPSCAAQHRAASGCFLTVFIAFMGKRARKAAINRVKTLRLPLSVRPSDVLLSSLILLLLRCGDVESNPGPSAMERLIKDMGRQLSHQIGGISNTLEDIQVQLRQKQEAIDEVKQSTELLWHRVEEQEVTRRRDNIIVYGVPEYNSGPQRSETETQLVDKIVNILNFHYCDSTWTENDITSAHRLGKWAEDRTRPVVVRFLKSRHKRDVISNRLLKISLRKEKIKIDDDLTKKQRETVNELRDKGFVAYFRGMRLFKRYRVESRSPDERWPSPDSDHVGGAVSLGPECWTRDPWASSWNTDPDNVDEGSHPRKRNEVRASSERRRPTETYSSIAKRGGSNLGGRSRSPLRTNRLGPSQRTNDIATDDLHCFRFGDIGQDEMDRASKSARRGGANRARRSVWTRGGSLETGGSGKKAAPGTCYINAGVTACSEGNGGVTAGTTASTVDNDGATAGYVGNAAGAKADPLGNAGALADLGNAGATVGTMGNAGTGGSAGATVGPVSSDGDVGYVSASAGTLGCVGALINVGEDTDGVAGWAGIDTDVSQLQPQQTNRRT